MSSALNPFRNPSRAFVAVALGVALVTPAPAQANGDSVWSECVNNGSVSTNHSQSDFQDALTNPPADGAEYTDCLSVISAAQKKAALGGGSTGGGGGTGGGGTGNAAPGTLPGGLGAQGQSVEPQALQKALTQSGVNPAAPPGAPAPAPAPSVVGGERIDLTSDRLPSLANTMSLPLPLAASAVVVLASAGLPVVRFAAARYGAPPTGTPTL